MYSFSGLHIVMIVYTYIPTDEDLINSTELIHVGGHRKAVALSR